MERGEAVLEEAPCNFCGNTERERLFRGTDRMYKSVPDGVWCDVVRCRRCGLVYLNPRVNEVSIGLFYPESEYYAHREPASGPGRLACLKRDVFLKVARQYFGYPDRGAGEGAGMDGAQARVLAALAFRLLPSRFRRIPTYTDGGRLLEFGFGAGDFLCRLQELGWECWGVERSAAARARVSAVGVNAFADIKDPAIPKGYFDYVTSYHAVEHVFDPKGVLQRMCDILRPGGRIFCGVPNFDSVMGRLFRTYWDNLGVPIHPYIFTANSLRMFLEASGFNDVRLRYHSLAVGVTGSVQCALNAVIWRLGGEKYVNTTFRDSRLFRAMVAPLVWLLDISRLGDCIEATATRA